MEADTLAAGAPWRYVNAVGAERRYEVATYDNGTPKVTPASGEHDTVVCLDCLDAPHPTVPGYAGGGSRQAWVTLRWLRQRPAEGRNGWLAGTA